MKEEISKELKDQIVNIANSMISGEIDIIKGCWLLCSAFAKLNHDLTDADIFLPIVAVESETDIYPLGDDRKHYKKKYLLELDQKREGYIERYSEEVIEDCYKLIHDLETYDVNK